MACSVPKSSRALFLAAAGQDVVLSGWVNSSRNLGGLVFIDLRDREGVTQLFIDPEKCAGMMQDVKELRDEWVITVKGKVIARPENMINKDNIGHFKKGAYIV